MFSKRRLGRWAGSWLEEGCTREIGRTWKEVWSCSMRCGIKCWKKNKEQRQFFPLLCFQDCVPEASLMNLWQMTSKYSGKNGWPKLSWTCWGGADSNESIAIYQSKPTPKNKEENSPLIFGQFLVNLSTCSKHSKNALLQIIIQISITRNKTFSWLAFVSALW